MTCAPGLLCAEDNVGNLKKVHFQVFWDSCAQNKTSEISKNAYSGILALLCAEQDVGNLKNCASKNSGTPVRRTRRRKSQKLHFQEFCDSYAQTKASEISNNALSGFRGLLCADQNVGNLENYVFWISGTPVHRTTRPKYQEMHVHKFCDSCVKNTASEISKHARS